MTSNSPNNSAGVSGGGGATPVVPDMDRIRRNLERMKQGGATKAEVAQYLAMEKLSEKDIAPEQVGFFRSLLSEWPVIVGGTIGSIAGAPGGPPGMIAGAALGSAGGEGYKQVIDRARGKEVPETSLEAAKEIAKEGAIGAAGEAGGQIATKALNKALAPFAKRVIPEVKAMAKELFKRGGRFTPAQLTDSAILDMVENMVESAPFGRDRIITQKAGALKAWDRWTKELADEIGPLLGDRQVGELILGVGEQGINAHRVIGGELYEKASKLMPKEKIVLLDDLWKVAEKHGEIFTRTRDIGKTAKSHGLLRKVLNLGDVVEQPASTLVDDAGEALRPATRIQENIITFEDARTLRSELLSMQRDLSEAVGEGKAKRIINDLVGALDGGMEDAAQKASPEALEAWRTANAFWKEGKQVFENKFLANLFIKNNKTPERVSEYVLRSGNIEEIRTLKKALRLASQLSDDVVYDDTWQRISRNHLEGMIHQNTNPKDGILNPRAILKSLTDNKRMRTMQEIYSPQQLKQIKLWATAAQRIIEKQPGGGGMVMQLAQGGAFLALATGQFEKTARTVFAGPYVLSVMLTNPTTAKWLTTGLYQLEKKGMVSAGLMSRLTAKAAEIQHERQKEEEGQYRSDAPRMPNMHFK